jgi:hypothetical protein
MTPDPPPEQASKPKRPPGWQSVAALLQDNLRKAIREAVRDVRPELEQIAKDGGHAATDGLLGDIGSLVKVIEDVALTAVLAEFGPLDALLVAKTANDAGGKVGRGFGWGYFLGTLGFQALQPWLLPLFQESNNLSQFAIFDPSTAAQLEARRIVGQHWSHRDGNKSGMTDDRMDLLVQAAQHWPALAEILELRRRGEIQPGDAHTALQRDGVPEDWIPHLLTLAQVLLSPADLALALLRGNMQLPDAQAYAKRLGISNDDLDLLTLNTGEPLGLEEMLLAYRLGYIGLDRLQHGVRQSRVRNEWFDVVEKLKYRPPPTADAIRGSVEHYIPFDKARDIAATNGLDPKEFQWVWESWGDPISKTEALELWRRGKIGPDLVVQALRESRLKDKWTPYVLELKRELLPIRQLLMVVQHGLQPPEWAVQILIGRGYTPDDAATLVQIETEGKAAIHKELAQGLILEMYEARAISHDDALSDLAQLGWTTHQGEFILATADAKVTLQEQRKAETAIRKAFLGSRIDESTAREQLGKIGVYRDQADILLRDWNIELEGRVLELSPGDVADAARYGGIGPVNAHKKLVELGYTEDDAWIYLAAHQVQKPPDTVSGGGLHH